MAAFEKSESGAHGGRGIAAVQRVRVVIVGVGGENGSVEEEGSGERASLPMAGDKIARSGR